MGKEGWNERQNVFFMKMDGFWGNSPRFVELQSFSIMIRIWCWKQGGWIKHRAHRKTKWLPRVKQNLDKIQWERSLKVDCRHVADSEDGCKMFEDYMLHPLQKKGVMGPLKNAAVVLNGPCRLDLLRIISLNEWIESKWMNESLNEWVDRIIVSLID